MSVKVIADTEEARFIKELMDRARKAQKEAETYSQERVDELVNAIAWEIVCNKEVVDELAKLALEETELGDFQSKVGKLSGKPMGLLYDLNRQKSVGIVEEIPERGLSRIAKPVGVVGSLVPSTQPEMIPVMQAMCAIKARDAIIYSPHPRGKYTTVKTVNYIRQVLKKYGAPEDLAIAIEAPEVALTNELMRQCDLVMATGGTPMVKAAHSSGTPAFGVGAGNAQIVIDKTADLAAAAAKIKISKTFDLAAGCSCDNSLIIHEDVYDAMLEELGKVGAYLVPAEKKLDIQAAIWPEYPKNRALNRDVVAHPAADIARIAKLDVPADTCMFLVEETELGANTPFAGEKMCLVTTVYKFKTIEEAINIVVTNQAYSGMGHSCGIYSEDAGNIEKFALGTYTTRVVVNLPQSATNGGSWNSGMPFAGSLGCGTWGGNIASENIVLKHFMNNTWVIREIENFKPETAEIFAMVNFQPKD